MNTFGRIMFVWLICLCLIISITLPRFMGIPQCAATFFWYWLPCRDPLFGNYRRLNHIRQASIIASVIIGLLITCFKSGHSL